MINKPVMINLDHIPLLQNMGCLVLADTRELFLLECYIAGTRYVDDMDILFEKIRINEILVLRREPTNEHDELAVLVLTMDESKLGYIPRYQNEVISNLLSAGKILYAVITEKDGSDYRKDIDIKVYMRE